MSRPAPYAKAVRDAALDCLGSGVPRVLEHVVIPGTAPAGIKVGERHRLLIFVGPTAWKAAKWFVDRGATCEHRAGFVLVLPPDDTLHPGQYQWPVDRRSVVLVDTGAGLHALEPMVDVLRRDRARECFHYVVDRDFPADDLDWCLQRLHAGDPVAPMAAWDVDYQRRAA